MLFLLSLDEGCPVDRASKGPHCVSDQAHLNAQNLQFSSTECGHQGRVDTTHQELAC